MFIHVKVPGNAAMISVQDAVNATLAYVKQFEVLMPSSNIRLEEFRFEEGIQTWYITLSFLEPPAHAGAGAFALSTTRSFKTFTVDASGKVVAMKIRNPLAP